jgi:proline dehydrogenase
LVVASHNHRSIDLTCELMDANAIPRDGGWVSFGQLLGMQDGMTAHLAVNGFKALKYVPYGPVPVVIPYLHRRAQENAGMVEAMASDKSAIFIYLNKILRFIPESLCLFSFSFMKNVTVNVLYERLARGSGPVFDVE